MNESVRAKVLEGSAAIECEPWPLPAGWVWARLGDAAAVNPTTSFDHLFPRSEITFVPMAAVAEESGLIKLLERRSVGAVAKGYVRFRQGDVIFAKITPCMENGKVAPVPDLDGGVAAGSTEFHVLRPCAIDQRFLWYWLVSRAFRGRAKRSMSGSAGQLRVPASYLREAPLPIPPLAEQRRIVARIDALFAEIAEGEAALTHVRDGLDTFRRALLKAAVTGELTEDWRETNQPNESGHDLVARIRATRADKEHVGRRGRRAGEVPPPDTAQANSLPEGWVWGTLGEIGEIVGGVTVDAKRRPDDPVKVPYLRVANVQRGRLDLTETKSITVERSTADRLRLERGDLLLNEGGDRDKIGRGWVWEDGPSDMIHQNHVFRVRLSDRGLSPHFVSHYANEMGRRFFVEQGKQTTNLASISLSKVSALRVPIPPPAEATEILRRVSDALAALDDSRAMLDAEAADAARLRQSVLKAAFEGRLAPQDPADEPASVMLARMKTDRSGSAVARGRGRRKASGAAAERSHEDRGI